MARNIETEDKDGAKLIKEFIGLYEKYEKRQSLNEIKDHCSWLYFKHKACSNYLRPRIKESKIKGEENT